MKIRRFNTYIILTLSLLFLLFSTCTGTSDGNSDSQLLTSQNQSNNNVKDITSSNEALSSASYYNTGGGQIITNSFRSDSSYFNPTSYIVDGFDSYTVSPYVEGIVEKREIARDFEKSQEIKNIYAVDYYDPSSTGYDHLPKDKIVFKYIGNWNVTPVKVKYINFTIDDRYTPEQEWSDFFKELLGESTGNTDTPVFISEAWLFDINGIKCAAVNAGNLDLFYKEEQIFPIVTDGSVPAGENHITYRMSAIFAQGMSPKDILSYKEIIPILSDSAPREDTFVKPQDMSSTEAVYTYQYNSMGEILRYPTYISGGLHYYRTRDVNLTYSVADIDADGETEILAYHDGWGSLYISFDSFILKNGAIDFGEFIY